jgi:hypothetical protein
VLADVRNRPLRRDGAHTGAIALAAAIVIAFSLTGCGDDGDGESAGATTTSPQASASTSTTTAGGNGGDDAIAIERAGPEKQVRRAVEAVLTSGDPADACGRYVTRRYLKAAYGGRQGCVQAQGPGSVASSLRSFSAQLGQAAGTARAVAGPVGGPYDGVEVEVSLIQGGPGYEVDALRSDIPVGP